MTCDSEHGDGATLLSKHGVFAGRVLDLELHDIRLPGGATCRIELARHRGAAAVVPLTAAGEVVLLRQLRYAAHNGYLIEIPAGKLDGGEAPEVCARRELAEEAGLTAGSLTALGPIWTTPGFSDEQIHLYLAQELSPCDRAPEPDEVIEVLRMPLGAAFEAIGRGDITDAKTICALARTALKLGRLR